MEHPTTFYTGELKYQSCQDTTTPFFVVFPNGMSLGRPCLIMTSFSREVGLAEHLFTSTDSSVARLGPEEFGLERKRRKDEERFTFRWKLVDDSDDALDITMLPVGGTNPVAQIRVYRQRFSIQ